jgi:zinc transport system substrate-binding protein
MLDGGSVNPTVSRQPMLVRQLAVLWLFVVAVGCDRPPQTPAVGTQEPARLTVAVSILPEAWLVQQIGGSEVRVVTLVRPGESAELYQPTDAQIQEVMHASVYFPVGMPFESGRAFQAIRDSHRLQVVELRQGIPLREMVPHSHAGAEAGAHAEAAESKDPHIWLSPRLLKLEAATIAHALEWIDAEHQETYRQNLAALVKKLDRLDDRVRRKLAPLRGKTFFVYHPAWGYFADEYGLRQVPIEIEGKEPTDAELTELQREVRREKARVIFAQPQTPQRAVRAIIQSVGSIRMSILDDLDPDPSAAIQRAADEIAQSAGS